MIFLNILFNCKSKYFIKSAIPENEKKQKNLHVNQMPQKIMNRI